MIDPPKLRSPVESNPLENQAVAGEETLETPDIAKDQWPGYMARSLHWTSRREREMDLEAHRFLKDAGYLTLPGPEPDNLIAVGMRRLGRYFAPEVIHYHKVSIASSVLTAFKRRNPLCLIDPTILSVSW